MATAPNKLPPELDESVRKSKIILQKPNKPEYSTPEARLATFEPQEVQKKFESLPSNMIEEFVEAEMYYAGYEDCVKCFMCGTGFKSWRPRDHILASHVKHQKPFNCSYVRMILGDAVIFRILQDKHDNLTRLQMQTIIVEAESLSDAVMKHYNPETRRALLGPPPYKTEAELYTITQELKLECVICLNSSPTIAYMPCGHLKTCASCSIGLKQCPVCRRDIKSLLRPQIHFNDV